MWHFCRSVNIVNGWFSIEIYVNQSGLHAWHAVMVAALIAYNVAIIWKWWTFSLLWSICLCCTFTEHFVLPSVSQNFFFPTTNLQNTSDKTKLFQCKLLFSKNTEAYNFPLQPNVFINILYHGLVYCCLV